VVGPLVGDSLGDVVGEVGANVGLHVGMADVGERVGLAVVGEAVGLNVVGETVHATRHIQYHLAETVELRIICCHYSPYSSKQSSFHSIATGKFTNI